MGLVRSPWFKELSVYKPHRNPATLCRQLRMSSNREEITGSGGAQVHAQRQVLQGNQDPPTSTEAHNVQMALMETAKGQEILLACAAWEWEHFADAKVSLYWVFNLGAWTSY